MTHTTQNTRRSTLRNAIATALVGLSLVAGTAQAQQAIGVPFLGRNHLSFSVTELSRDGIGQQRAGVFGGVYGRQLNGENAAVKYTVIARTAVRALDGSEDGIVDAGFTLAATHQLNAIDGLSITGAAGLGAMVWGQAANDLGRVVSTTPLSLGLAYDIRLGRATIAPFATLVGAYSNERNYAGDNRISQTDGWRLGHATGVSVRFREVVLSLSDVNGERGMPHKNRAMFSAGISW